MRSWSLRRRLTVSFAIAALLTVAAIAVGIAAFTNVIDTREELIDQIDPAAVSQRDALASMVNQESGVRGFTLAGDETFLAPYEEGTEAAIVAAEQLQALFADAPELQALLDDAIAAASAWRTEFAEPEIARVRAFGPGEASEDVLVEGQQLFGAVRAALADIEAELNIRRDAARDELDRATSVLLGSLAAIALVVVAVGVLAWIAFTRWTLVPLDRLGEDTRIVAAGDLAHELRPSGPAEIARLGGDVEAMRRRISDEVAEVDAARAELDERARELLRSNADLEQFAYVASHDLQEPLRKVTSFCQLLQRRYGGQLDERADQYIAFAVDGARRMQILINDLLTFSRVGRTTEGFSDVEVRAALQRALDDLDAPLTDAGAQVEVGDLPTVSGDATLLVMLFRNLVGNAVKFRSEAPPVIRIDATRGAGEWLFSFADNGIGIEPEYADKVFVIFQRLHPRERYEGTGIGLALAKKIVEFHGGSIWIDTDAHPGTTICFTLPDPSAELTEPTAGAPDERDHAE